MGASAAPPHPPGRWHPAAEERPIAVLVIPSIDVERGRSRVVFWPGSAAGTGTPTDRPDRIAERLVALGAPVVHLVDLDGARAGIPRNLESVSAIAARVAVPLQVAGGMEDPDAIRLAFASGATRVVLAMGVADRPDLLASCLAVAGDWLAVGLDPRPERLAEYPWRGRTRPASLDALVGDLVAAGVRRFVLSHGGTEPDAAALGRLAAAHDADVLVAGGVTDLDGIERLRGAGVSGVILGEAILSGRIDLAAAIARAA
jgi:phosphoribosylformimino-5-aminoimidazole carboxamide ribotide isomerase